MKKKDYNKLLQGELQKHYSPEQIEEFSFYPDKEDDVTFAFKFIDHEGNKKKLTHHKHTGHTMLIGA